MSNEDPIADEWTDERGRRDFQRLMPWNSKRFPYRLTTFALGRVERNVWLYWLGFVVFAVSGLIGIFIFLSFHAFIYERFGELIEEIMFSIVFLPPAALGLYGLLAGYIPSNAMNHIHRGRRVMFYNAGLTVTCGVSVGMIFAIGVD